MRQFWEVLVFSYRDRIRAKVFLYTTLLVIALLALVMSVPKLEAMFVDQEPEQFVVIDQTEHYVKSIEDLQKNVSDKADWRLEQAAKEQELREQLKDEESKLTGLVLIEQKVGTPPTVKLVVDSMPDGDIVQPLQTYIQSQYTMSVLQALKLTPEQFGQIMGQVAVDVDDLSKRKEEDRMNSYFPIYAMIMILSMSIIGFCTAVATAVAAEKSSRIMEIMITKVRPIWLMFGKVVGVGLAGLTQIALIAIAAFALSLVLYEGPIEFGGFRLDLTTMEASMFVYFLIFYVLGYFFYATLYAAVGSLVSRSEEVNQVIMPITTIFMIAMYSAMFSFANPDNTFAVVGSFVPFLSPLLMFIRIGMTEVPMIQIVASIAILFLSIVVGCWVAAKVYRVGVLTYGKRPTWKEIIAAIRIYRV